MLLEQCSQQVKDISFSHLTARAEAGVHQKLGGDRTKTGDPTWPKGYPIPYGIMLNHKTRENLLGGLLLLADWLGNGQLVLSNYILHYLFHVFFFFFPLFFPI